MTHQSSSSLMFSHFAMGGAFAAIILIAVLWSLVWKGIALWYAARNDQKIWFIVMLVLNTLGILEIIYLLFFRKNKGIVVIETPTMTIS